MVRPARYDEPRTTGQKHLIYHRGTLTNPPKLGQTGDKSIGFSGHIYSAR